MKIRHCVAAMAAIFGLGISVFLVLHGPFDIKIPQAMVQQAIDKKIPMEKSKGPIHYTISEAVVALRDDGKIGLILDVKAEFAKRSITAHLVGAGKITYANSSFYLSNFAAESVKFDKSETKPSDHKLFNSIKEKVLDTLDLDNASLLEFLNDNRQAILTKITETSNHLVNTVLAKHPIYTIHADNVKMAAAQIMLDKVTVSDGTLTVTLDPITGILRIIGYILICLMALVMVIAIVMSPAGPAIAMIGSI